MASGPIISWQIDGETMETVRDFIFLGSKITADGECSHEIKRCLLLARKAMTNLESILESRDITLLRKVCLVKAMVFPVVMYGCESWTTKKAEQWRIDAFELWCWRRLLRVPWTARRSNQSILKEISPEYSLEGLMLKLKLQYFGHLMWRTDSLEKTLRCWKRLKAGGEGDNRGWDGWMSSLTQWAWVWVGSGSWWWTGKPGVLQSMEWQSRTRLSDWTELNLQVIFFFPKSEICAEARGDLVASYWVTLNTSLLSKYITTSSPYIPLANGGCYPIWHPDHFFSINLHYKVHFPIMFTYFIFRLHK